ncbi:MAG: ABC transporter ATP-binding protein [Maricaulaceae bacterium]
MTETILDYFDVSKRFGEAFAVRDVSFSVARGSILGFLGPNGAGKTTTLRMGVGLVAPDQGSTQLFGERPSRLALDKVGFLPEERGLYRKMRAIDVITFFARMKGLDAQEAKRRGRDLLERYGLADAVERKIKAMSKGMAQKVQILATLAHDPELVILDEPFSGLDPVNQKTLEDLIRQIAQEGRTIVFSTHVMEHAERLCDRIVLMARGRKIFDGDLEAALSQSPTRIVVDGNSLDALAQAGRALGLNPEPAEDGGLVIDLQRAEQAEALLAASLEAGVNLKRFETRRPSLHETFVRLVSDAEPIAEAA